MFEKAIRLKLRFPSSVGLLTVEDLWDLPLTTASSTRASLNNVAKGIARQLKTTEEEDFVAPAKKGDDALQLQLEIVKHVIATKQEEAATAKDLVDRREKKERLLELIARKQDQALEGKPLEELQAMVASL